MSIDLNTVSLPFDRWGNAATNLMKGERQTLTSVAWTEFNILIPKYAPFYSESIANDGLIHVQSGRRLVRGKDWIEGWYFQSASGEIGMDLHCCIYFYDNTLSGEIEIDSYQAMGGEWQINGNLLTRVLANALLNPLRYYWEQIAELPEIFNPLDHDQDIQDFTKLGSLIDVLEDIAKAVGKVDTSLPAHIADQNNPHKTNKGHVGLPLVENYPMAVLADIAAGSLKAQAYMSPPMTYQMIQQVAIPVANAHAQRIDNPHNTRANQTGAYFTTEVDALLESLARGLVHNLYAYRLEGKSVQDIVDAASGNIAGSVTQLRSEINAVQTSVNAHAQRQDNPHNTRADRTGAYFTTEVDALLTSLAAGNLHNLYAYRLENNSVADIVNSAVTKSGTALSQARTEIMQSVTDTLKTYKAADSAKFAGKSETEWNSAISTAVSNIKVGWTIPSPQLALQSDTNAAIVLIASLKDTEQASTHRSGFSFRTVFGAAADASIATQYVDLFVTQDTQNGWGIKSAGVPAGVTFFLENWFDDSGAVVAGGKRLYMRVPAAFPSIGVFAFSMLGVTKPAATDVWRQQGWAGRGTPLATHEIGLTTVGTKEMVDKVQTDLTTLNTTVTALERSNRVRYAQDRTIEANTKITIDMQSLVTDPADVTKYDYTGARVNVLLLDKVTGSSTLGAYINSEETITKALRGNRYLDLWNYDSVQVTVAVRIELPLL